jgi:prolyl 4-hydroxylase
VRDLNPSRQPYHTLVLGTLTLHHSGGTFSSSLASSGSGQAGIYNTRTSQSTSVQRTPIVRCIETRALHFQGFDLPRTHLEPLQLVSYTQKQAFHYHTDWFPPEPAAADPSGNRVSSFFAYIQAQNLTGGGTNFPLLDAPRDERWCKYVDCDEEIEKGVTFRAVEGNAVFWQNLVDGGRGDERSVYFPEINSQVLMSML